MSLKKLISQEKLTELYVHQHLSDKAIAVLYGCTDVAISKLRRRYQIPTLRQFDRLRLQHSDKPNVELITDEQFFLDYTSLTQHEFCEKYGISTIKLKSERKRRDLQKKEDFMRESLPEPTPEQKAIFIGGLLGDGGVYPAGKTRAFYQESHSVNQDVYVKTLHALLQPFSNSLRYYTEKRVGQDTLGFKTKPIKYLRQLRSLFYSSDRGSKDTLPVSFLIENWHPSILAYWFFGDGELKENLPIIGTAFQEGLPQMVDFLNQTYQIDARIRSYPSIPKMSFVQFRNRDAFFNIIAPYVTADLIYKVPVEHRQHLHSTLIHQFRLRAVSGYNGDLKKYKSSLYQLLSETEKSEWVDQVFDYYRTHGFPYIRMSEELLTERIQRFRNCVIQPNGKTLQYKTQGLDICKNFMPHIYEARVGKNQSPVVQWGDDIKLRNLILNRFKYAPDVSVANMRRGVDLNFKTVANFKPSVSKWICENYGNGGTVYLPDAGFGGKLLGALVSDVSGVICLDPLDKTIEGSKALAQRVDPNKPCRFVMDCAEDFIPKDLIGGVDLVLSCPPYFDKEIYSEDESQSIKRYTTYAEWVERFLAKSIDNFHHLLSEDGVYAVVIGDEYLDDLMRCVQGKFYLSDRYYVPLGSVFHKKDGKHLFTYESLLIFKKGSHAGVSLTKMEGLVPPAPRAKKTVKRSQVRKQIQKVDGLLCIQALQAIASQGLPTTRDAVKSRVDLFPFSTSSVEKHFGSWGNFQKIAAVESEYKSNSDRQKVIDYRLMCQKHGRVLSFHELEKEEKVPASRYKRMFNAGKSYSHLKDQLEQVILADDGIFEKWLEQNFPK